MDFREGINEDLGIIFGNEGIDIIFENQESNMRLTVKSFPLRKEQSYSPLENVQTYLPSHTITVRNSDIDNFTLPNDLRKLKVSWMSLNKKIEAIVIDKRISNSNGITTFICFAEMANNI